MKAEIILGTGMFIAAVLFGAFIYILITADNTDYRDASLKQQLTESQHLLELSEGRYQALCDRAPVECLKVE